MYAVWVEKVQIKYAEPIKERISALKLRRTHILDHIDQVEHEPLDVRPPSDDLYRLQQEYNLLVDEETDLMRRTFTDPLEALPPELWPSFLPKDTDEMMILTTISRRWCQALLSTPTLWTTVVFDDRKADYMAKATTCLHLSRPVGIELDMRIRFERWNTLASIILPESARIRRLSIQIHDREDQFHDQESVAECLTILGCFEELPALQILFIPFNTTSLSWGPGGLMPVDRSRDPTAPPLFRRFPFLLDAVGFSFRPQTLLDPAFRRLERVKTFRLDESTVEILSQLHSLTSLYVSEAKFDVRDPDKQVRPVAPLSSITQFEYQGVSTLSTLKFIGDQLTHLDAAIETFDLAELLQSIGRFCVLSHLTLSVCPSRRKRGSHHRRTPVPSPSPVRTLFLTFWGLLPPPRIGHSTLEQDVQREMEVNREVCAVAFRSLIFVIPLAERVMIEGQFPADAAIRYIRSLPNLRSLSISMRNDSPPMVKPTIDWLPYLLPADYLDKFQTNSLRHLNISNDIPRSLFLQFSEIGFDDSFIHARRYTISSTPIPSVLSLVLSIESHLLLNLHTFPNLQTVVLSSSRPSSSLTMRASDFFEELLLQPNQWPSLERIGISGDYMEWDILILMLERRNFVAESSVSRIKTLTLSSDIPYKLLYPITHLLNGKFPKRPSLSEFSIDEIGRRLCNSELPGCHRCIRMLRPCDSPIYGVYRSQYWDYEDDKRLGWEYELPHERLRPDPPLSLNTAKWLSAKRSRRLQFVEMVDVTRTQNKRKLYCCVNFDRYDMVNVARYSMDGAKFEA